jgi:hypothetical protein
MFRIEPSVVLRQIRIAAIAEDALHEIQVAHQTSRHEETHLHRFLGRMAGHFRGDDRTQQQGNETLCLVLLR